jgi:hypothetical protein
MVTTIRVCASVDHSTAAHPTSVRGVVVHRVVRHASASSRGLRRGGLERDVLAERKPFGVEASVARYARVVP